jgi:Pvc16 N-terminal domain
VSTAYGMAGVTAVLKARLEDRIADADVQAAIGPVNVTAVPPDQVQAGAAEPNQLNVWLHHAAPNAAWRNEVHPIRDSTGRRVARPPLALDLQYLITAFGVETSSRWATCCTACRRIPTSPTPWPRPASRSRANASG